MVSALKFEGNNLQERGEGSLNTKDARRPPPSPCDFSPRAPFFPKPHAPSCYCYLD